MINEVEDCFLAFEKSPRNSELIDRIFRMIHTIKGSGSVAGFTKLARFAHQFENLLSLVRSGTLEPDPEVIDAVFAANDILKSWIFMPQLTPDSEVDTEACVANLLKFCSPHQKAAPPEKPMPAFGFFDDDEERQTHILLVDDETGIIEAYESYLEDLHALILKAANGKEAIAILRKQRVDVVVTDLKMPELDGIGLIVYIRKEFPDLPTIFVSGASDRNDIIRLLNAGAYAFIDKPVQRENLLNHVRNAMRDSTIRELVLRLTPLNFRAYLGSSRLARVKNEQERHEIEASIRTILDELTVIQNEILLAKFPRLKP